MNYGTVSSQTRIIGGKAVEQLVIYTESVTVHTDIEAAEQFYALLEDFKQGKLINPGIQVEVYPDTGRIKRVVKSWTEVKS